MRTDTPKTIYLKDYTPTPYAAKHVDLTFEIFDGRTVVHAKTQWTKNEKGRGPFFLHGEALKLLSFKIDGKDVQTSITDYGLTVNESLPDSFVLDVVTEIEPEKNTRLEGLYCSGGNYCTQCEAEGFRRITYYTDRPDVMATFRVRIEADAKSCPVLLSNGNMVEKGSLGSGRHFTVWDDP
ncbi:MAG: aminopeptidase N, partial [Micavibrio aeruginosavorus]